MSYFDLSPESHPPIFVAKHISDCYLLCGQKKSFSHPLVITRDTRNRDRDKSSEPVLLNVYGAPALIPGNEFRQPM
jgi:hypothetical protein